MGWVCDRPATEEDQQRLDRTCTEFIRRYGGRVWMDPERWLASREDFPNSTLDLAWHLVDSVDWQERSYYADLLRRRIRRALRHKWAEGIAYDCVGWSRP